MDTENLIQTYPGLTRLLDAQGRVIAPLFDEWSRQVLRTAYMHSRSKTSVADFLRWGLDHGAPAATCVPLFLALLSNLDGHMQTSNNPFQDLRTHHPQALQDMFRSVWGSSDTAPTDMVWSTAMQFKYAPDPATLYQPSQFTTKSKAPGAALAWARQLPVQHHLSVFTMEDLPHRLMRATMGEEGYRLWQMGAWFDLLSRNQNVDDVSGSTYNPYGALRCVIFPGLAIGDAPEPKAFMETCFKRYKGKKMAQDLLEGTAKAMDWAQDQQRPDALAYCSSIVQHLIPHALAEDLNRGSEADRMDRVVIQCLNSGKLTVPEAWTWIEQRMAPQVKRPIALSILSGAPLPLLELVAKVWLKNPLFKSVGKAVEEWGQGMVWRGHSVGAMVGALTNDQWTTLLDEWNTPEKSMHACALLTSSHPRVESFKYTQQARLALAAESLRFLDLTDSLNSSTLRWNSESFLWRHSSENMASMALPQPMEFFSRVFPQYLPTWQQLSVEMVQSLPESSRNDLRLQGSPFVYPREARTVIDAMVAVLMDAPVSAAALREMRNMVGGDIPYETLLANTLKGDDTTFVLPDVFPMDTGGFGEPDPM